MAPTLLQRIEELCNVDVDDASTKVIQSIPFMPHNQTSNQGIITAALLDDPALLRDSVVKHGSLGWENVYDHAIRAQAVHLCARNVPYLSGRVLIQTSLRYVHSRQEIISQCRKFARLFAEAGVPADRFAIKLPFSGAAASAAEELNREGIRTLATAVFSLEQAIAASQSGCLFISPYFNEINAHLDKSLHVDYQDTALENPMSCRIIHMLEFFAQEYKKSGKPQPIMVLASFLTTSEVLAAIELGCPHITVPANLIKILNETHILPSVASKDPTTSLPPYAGAVTAQRLAALADVDPLAGPNWSGSLATADTDYVADNGVKLDDFLKNDPVANERFGQAERFFLLQEEVAKAAIEKEMVALGIQVLN